MASLKTLLPLLLLSALTDGQTPAQESKESGESKGACRRVDGVANFDVNRFPGLWFHHAIGGVPQDLRCTHEYQFHVGDGRIQFFQQAVRSSDGQNVTREALATPISTLQRSSFNVSFNSGMTRKFVIPDTDYDNYAILYHCSTTDQGETQEIVLVMTRQRNPDDSAEDVLESAIEDAEFIDAELLTKTDQMNCPMAVQPCLKNTTQGTYERC